MTAVVLRLLTYATLTGCTAAWLYAAYHAYHFEVAIWAAYRSRRIPQSISPAGTLFAQNLPATCAVPRKKVYRALSVFVVLSLCLIIILYFRWP